MKQAFIVLTIFFSIMFFIIWASLTRFGKRSGVYIDQDTELVSIIDSTYHIRTCVWNTEYLGIFGDRTIEWMAYKTVKCYDVLPEKNRQYGEALLMKKRVVDFKKLGVDCKPE